MAAGVVACDALHAPTNLSVVVPLELVFQLPPLAVLLLFDVHTQLPLYPPGCFPITWPERCLLQEGLELFCDPGLVVGEAFTHLQGNRLSTQSLM